MICSLIVPLQNPCDFHLKFRTSLSAYRWQGDLGARDWKMLALPPQTVESGMPCYFFDIHDGLTFSRDRVGTACDGPAEVRSEAMRALPAIARDEIPGDGDRQAFMVLVRDEDGTTVYTATLTFAGSWVGGSPIPEPHEGFLS